MIRLVATDLDGTLLKADGTISDRSLRAIAALQERDVQVVFVTGRPIRWVTHLWEQVGRTGPAICSNGAVTVDVATHEILALRPVPREVALRVADLIRTAVPGSTFSVERTASFAHETGFPPRLGHGDPHRAPDGALEDIVADDVVKMLALHEAADAEPYWRRLVAVVGDQVTATWSSAEALVELSGAGVTKGSTLATLCQQQGVTADEVLAIGDMPNDVDMLRWAGTSYAMADGHRDARAAADHLAPPNDQDGAAMVLEGLLGGSGVDRRGTSPG